MFKKYFVIWGMVMFAVAAPEIVPAEPLGIGVAPTLELKETHEYYRPLIDYIGRKLGIPTKLILRENNKAIYDLLDQGHVKIAFIDPLSYVHNREMSGSEILAVPQVNGQPFYYSYILVRNDSPIKELSDLRGKRFAFTVPKSFAGEFAPTYLIARQFNKKPDKFFSSIQSVRSYEEAVYLLANGRVDGCQR